MRQHLTSWNGSTDPRTRTGFRLTKILVPSDFSECSKAALTYATGLAHDFKAQLQLVHVINAHWYPFGDKYSSLDAAQLMEDASRAAHKQMRSMAATSNVRYSVRVIHGLPAAEICHAARFQGWERRIRSSRTCIMWSAPRIRRRNKSVLVRRGKELHSPSETLLNAQHIIMVEPVG